MILHSSTPHMEADLHRWSLSCSASGGSASRVHLTLESNPALHLQVLFQQISSRQAWTQHATTHLPGKAGSPLVRGLVLITQPCQFSPLLETFLSCPKPVLLPFTTSLPSTLQATSQPPAQAVRWLEQVCQAQRLLQAPSPSAWAALRCPWSPLSHDRMRLRSGPCYGWHCLGACALTHRKPSRSLPGWVLFAEDVPGRR